MDRLVYLNNLYDYYKDMFTEKQQNYFEDYYFNNLSLSEIAEIYHVSRNAVHNQLKIMEEKLQELESILRLYEKKSKVIEILRGNVKEEILEEVKNVL